MRVLAVWWLVSRPIRLIEVCSAIVLMMAATAASTFGTAVFLYCLASLLLVLLLMSYLDQDRPGR